MGNNKILGFWEKIFAFVVNFEPIILISLQALFCSSKSKQSSSLFGNWISLRVKLFDGKYPENSIEKIIDYYKISKKDFDENIDKWVNKKLKKKNNITKLWEPNFEIK